MRRTGGRIAHGPGASSSRRLRPLGLGAVAALLTVQAHAACLAPTPPDPASRPVKPSVPVKPPCADAKPGTPGCLGWESYSYNDAIKAYNAQGAAFQAAANAYLAKLNAYVAASGEYARCEVKAMQ